jgi:endo-1,4-beta-xylanase
MWKMGACIALSAAMTLTSTGGMLPSDWGIETVYADETQTTTKTFTAEQLEVIWGNAKSKLEDSKWKLSFENQYDQVKWKVPEAIALSDVKSVTFHVTDQKGSVTLKVYNGGDDAEAAKELITKKLYEKEIARGQMSVVAEISDVEVEIAEIEAGRLVEIELGGYCE